MSGDTADLRAARAEIVRLREIVNSQRAAPDYRSLQRRMNNAERCAARDREQRDAARAENKQLRQQIADADWICEQLPFGLTGYRLAQQVRAALGGSGG